MSDVITKLLFAIAAGAILYGAWQWDRKAQFAAGRAEVLATAQAAAAQQKAKNDALTAEREEAAAKAEFRHLERMRAVEYRDEKDLARAADLQRVVDRLRATRVAGDRRARPDPGAAAGACEQRGDERIEQLLAEGQRLAIEGAELLAAADGLVGEGERGLAKGASLIELAKDWGRAVKLGERPP